MSIGAPGYGLIVLCLALAATIVVELRDGAARPERAATAAPPAPAMPAPAVIKTRPLASYNEVVERPLFSETRRPAPVEVAATPAQAAVELRHLVLTGVLIGGPDDRLAILLDRSRGEEVRVRRGGEIGGWSLMEVRADGVTLRKGGVTHPMPLHPDETPPGTGAPASAGPSSRQQAKAQ